MSWRDSRRPALVAALLVLQVLVLSAGTFATHEGHGCWFDKDCRACRWAADTVVQVEVPVALACPVDHVVDVVPPAFAAFVGRSLDAPVSRGPPLA